MDALSVFRMDGSDPRLLGRINLDPVTFSYDPGYLADPDARAVSCSLPLRNEAYSESALVPYFDGLLPEGAARRAIAAPNRIPKRGFPLPARKGKRGSRICRARPWMKAGSNLWTVPLRPISSKRDRFPTSRCSSTCA